MYIVAQVSTVDYGPFFWVRNVSIVLKLPIDAYLKDIEILTII